MGISPPLMTCAMLTDKEANGTASIIGKRKGIQKSDLLVVGDSVRCKHSADIIDEINHTLNH